MEPAAAPSLRLTEAARLALESLFAGVQKPQLRVFLSFMHASGPRLEIAPDTAGEADVAVSTEGFCLCMARLLLEQAAPVVVDYGPEGFVVRSRLDFSEAGGHCGGKCDHDH